MTLDSLFYFTHDWLYNKKSYDEIEAGMAWIGSFYEVPKTTLHCFCLRLQDEEVFLATVHMAYTSSSYLMARSLLWIFLCRFSTRSGSLPDNNERSESLYRSGESLYNPVQKKYSSQFSSLLCYLYVLYTSLIICGQKKVVKGINMQ